ncbi:NADH dehydrogenase [ubiquinone] 1 subunit C2 [Oryzias melastigma]|uniref:NADH dehydrogenase [ubiquinone] 1 subunit C2 n=1 Tax=Oryzias melastigma TaxID=30732 RepID=A0A3B3B596_ORYME|nr:NADH dehydrogenase [ubiquinone] 1 subunit C2 [Oryzias melastigma]XP_024132927.1 NADH dehydrogenase [ubiquinone] 1 subunit C2 [Oryzias melastigma]KAF6724845.1 NADH dehydrogenase [ubiquinone] 1 subunit C2 [Oryzias melastigma]
MGSAADDKKSLPPPGIVNRNSVWLAGIGWFSAVLQNAINHRPPVKSGVHRQFLLATVGWFLGYHLTKHENYTYARLDRDMNEYVKIHPEKFQPKEKKTFAEIVEPFHPVR